MNKDNYTIEMKALCKAIEQEADALPLIQRLLEEKHISADDLKTMLRDDHNMVDASVVHQLVKAGVFTKEELVRDCHIDPGFVSMLGSTLVDMVEYNNNIQNIDSGNTEVYLWGIPSSGKTCALGALLCSLRNDKDVASRMVPIPSAQGFGYMTQLEQVFPLNNAICKLPGRTPTKTNFAIGLELEDTMGKVHPVTLVDMAGELFCYLHWMAVGRAGEYDDHRRALGTFLRILVDNPTDNRKIHLFVVEYGREGKKYKDTLQDQYLTTGLTYLKNTGVLQNHTDGIYVLVTKTDKIHEHLALGETPEQHVRQFIDANYPNFIGLLRRYCREFEICGGQLPPVFPFDIGDVCFQNYCRLNTDTAKVVAREILIRESKGFSQNRFVRTITDIFDN